MNASDVGNATNHVFAVEFDTVQDFEFDDVNDNHVGVDIHSLVSNPTASAAYYGDDGVKKDLNLKGGYTIQAWVDYDGAEKVLNVTLSPFSTKPSTPLLSFQVDLSPVLLDDMFVGFSASTGLLASTHYLFGWSFRMKGACRSLELSSLPSLPQPKKKNVTLTVAISVTAFVLLIAAVAATAYLFYWIKNADVIEAWELTCGPHRFSYEELSERPRGKATASSDVYSFGALVLEVVCGRRPVEPKALPEELVLVDWLWERWTAGRWADVVDHRLGEDYDREEAVVGYKSGALVLPVAWPRTREVVRYLDGGDVTEVPPLPSPSTEYDDSEGNDGFDDFVHL
ncbi:Lectin-domain containing receptor kinase [Musa troglodytarum]|uniref:Lectin-domain containing receptor kinase n=1 Tax=Musa troglodytarum TaxID=320322 RepID=A0A9E7IIY2_9LILI|nr:Lectin-domain containing receptor kinase [Musa troglodytarum]